MSHRLLGLPVASVPQMRTDTMESTLDFMCHPFCANIRQMVAYEMDPSSALASFSLFGTNVPFSRLRYPCSTRTLASSVAST